MWKIVTNKCSSTWLLGGALKIVRDGGMFCYSDNTHPIDARRTPVFGTNQNRTAIHITTASHPSGAVRSYPSSEPLRRSGTFPLLQWVVLGCDGLSGGGVGEGDGEVRGAAGRLSHSWILMTWTGDTGFLGLYSPISIAVSEKSRAQQWARHLTVLSPVSLSLPCLLPPLSVSLSLPCLLPSLPAWILKPHSPFFLFRFSLGFGPYLYDYLFLMIYMILWGPLS